MMTSSKKATEKRELTVLQKVSPTNTEAEKEKFFFDTNYNPQFLYPGEIFEEEFRQYGDVSEEYLPQALHILDMVLKRFGSESNFLQENEGNHLSQAEVTEILQNYLRENQIQNRIETKYSERYIARAAVIKLGENFELQLRLPLDFRENAFLGTLHHEIGTHVFRWLNEMEQPWYKNRKKFRLDSHLTTEEGLAALNSNLYKEHPYFWMYALYYYAVILASKMGFSSLYKELRKYIDDRDRCWKLCLRVKRGVKDTSQPMAFSKDQAYFTGIIQLAEWFRKNNFEAEELYIGKIAIEDLPRVAAISQKAQYIPAFFSEHYKKELEKLLKFNKL